MPVKLWPPARQVVKPIYEVIERVVEVPITTIQDPPLARGAREKRIVCAHFDAPRQSNIVI